MKLHLSNRYNKRANDTQNQISKTKAIDVVEQGKTKSNSNNDNDKSYGCYLVKMSHTYGKNKSLSKVKSKYMPDNSNLLNRVKIKSNSNIE